MSNTARTSFLDWEDDKLIYDERKKRFVHTKNMPKMLHQQYFHSSFKHVSCRFESQLILIAAKTRLVWIRNVRVQMEAQAWPAVDKVHELPD